MFHSPVRSLAAAACIGVFLPSCSVFSDNPPPRDPRFSGVGSPVNVGGGGFNNSFGVGSPVQTQPFGTGAPVQTQPFGTAAPVQTQPFGTGQTGVGSPVFAGQNPGVGTPVFAGQPQYRGVASGVDDTNARQALVASGVQPLRRSDVGPFLDQQQFALQQRLANTGVGVFRNTDSINLVMPGDLAFSPGQTNVSPRVSRVLDDVASVLNANPQSVVEIGGHTDSSGAAEDNERISHARASNVFDYLRSRGVSPARMIIVGYGEYRPATPTPDGVAEARNRRVEMRISPLT